MGIVKYVIKKRQRGEKVQLTKAKSRWLAFRVPSFFIQRLDFHIRLPDQESSMINNQECIQR